MIKLQRQAKITNKKKQTLWRKISYLKKVMFQICIGIVLALTILGFENFFSVPATANQLPEDSHNTSLLSANFFLSPATSSATITFPISENFEPTLTENVTSPAASLTPPFIEDYCMDIPVILYHHIQPLSLSEQLGHAQLTVDSSIFEEQVKYLVDNGYHPISADELIIALLNRQSLPEKSMLITIDDGYDDNYTYAFLMAKKYKVIMNFMIPTGLIDKPGYMNWDHLREMANNPYARIYNHTTSHAPLGLLDKDKIISEVNTANTQLEATLGIKNKIITYPYGSYSDLAIETLKEQHYLAAFSTDAGRDQCLSTIMRLPRLHIGNASMVEYGF